MPAASERANSDSTSTDTGLHPPQKQWWSSHETDRSGSIHSTATTPDQGNVNLPEKPAPAVNRAHARPRLASRAARHRVRTRPLRVRATAYAIHGRTASGSHTVHGTIAVDPRIIPIGTRIFVPGYGWGKALDTGGGVRGNVIDLWMPTSRQCYQWGNRHVEILVEAPPHRPLLASRSGALRPGPRKRRPAQAAAKHATTARSR